MQGSGAQKHAIVVMPMFFRDFPKVEPNSFSSQWHVFLCNAYVVLSLLSSLAVAIVVKAKFRGTKNSGLWQVVSAI